MKTIYVSPLIQRLRPELVFAIKSSASKHGYQVTVYENIMKKPRLDFNDCLIIWNRHLEQDEMATYFETCGHNVFVLENPYLDIPGKWFSFGIHIHNCFESSIPMQDTERFKSFNIELKPWRTKGDHILVATQAKHFNGSGLGWKQMKQPAGWDSSIVRQIRQRTNRTILFRQHPKGVHMDMQAFNNAVGKLDISTARFPIESDLENAWSTVVYTSNAATNSLLNGIPVMMTGMDVYMAGACNIGLMNMDNPLLPDNREKILQRMAWNQFSLKEIHDGFLFDLILDI